MSESLWPHGLQHARLPCPSPTPGACSNSCPLSWWCHSTISSSFVPFSSSLQSFPASGSFPMSQFSSGGQSIGASASTSVLSVDIQDWFPLGLTGLISLQSKGNVLGRIIKQEFKTGPNFKKPFSRGTLYSHCLKSKSTWKRNPHDYLLKRGQSNPPWGIASYYSETPVSKRSTETKSHRRLREKGNPPSLFAGM